MSVRWFRMSWVCVSAVGALAGISASITPAGAATAIPRCRAAQLRLHFVFLDAATGHRFWDFAYRNTGPTCTVRGYPRIVLLDRHGHRIAARIRHVPNDPPATLTLAHGKRALFTFLDLDGGFCPGHAFTAYRFKLAPPGTGAFTLFNPTHANHGPPSICRRSEFLTPLLKRFGP